MKGLKQGTKVLVFVIRPEWSKKREDVSIPSGMSLPKSWWGEAPDRPSDLPETIDTCNPSMRSKLRNAPSRRPSVCHLAAVIRYQAVREPRPTKQGCCPTK
jgi:hypothetical protein